MALSDKARKSLEIAMAESEDAPSSASKEVADAIDSGGNPTASDPGDLGALAPVVSVDVADAGPQLVSDAADTDAKLAAVQGKLDALMGALRAAGIIA